MPAFIRLSLLHLERNMNSYFMERTNFVFSRADLRKLVEQTLDQHPDCLDLNEKMMERRLSTAVSICQMWWSSERLSTIHWIAKDRQYFHPKVFCIWSLIKPFLNRRFIGRYLS
ncbi:hypothetical protein P879_04439 [Paragonimus westermani]|uniref:Uncharacterized protein n=1 Tax=Paragonimus westermani TaxID=34504 RepID=A0A8T0DMQ9_9TREM|nr:hypothetical protein P879_04439 [Paragonimus westermani]